MNDKQAKLEKILSTMLNEPFNISDIQASGDELYFSWKKKQIWSIGPVDSSGIYGTSYRLYNYKTSSNNVKNFINYEEADEVEMMTFQEDDLDPWGVGREKFKKLYQLLHTKQKEDFLDSILDEF